MTISSPPNSAVSDTGIVETNFFATSNADGGFTSDSEAHEGKGWLDTTNAIDDATPPEPERFGGDGETGLLDECLPEATEVYNQYKADAPREFSLGIIHDIASEIPIQNYEKEAGFPMSTVCIFFGYILWHMTRAVLLYVTPNGMAWIDTVYLSITSLAFDSFSFVFTYKQVFPFISRTAKYNFPVIIFLYVFIGIQLVLEGLEGSLGWLLPLLLLTFHFVTSGLISVITFFSVLYPLNYTLPVDYPRGCLINLGNSMEIRFPVKEEVFDIWPSSSVCVKFYNEYELMDPLLRAGCLADVYTMAKMRAIHAALTGISYQRTTFEKYSKFEPMTMLEIYKFVNQMNLNLFMITKDEFKDRERIFTDELKSRNQGNTVIHLNSEL